MSRADGTPVSDPIQALTLAKIDLGPKDALLALTRSEDLARRVNNEAVAAVHRRDHVDAVVACPHAEGRFAIDLAVFVGKRVAPGRSKDDLGAAEGENRRRFGEEPVVANLNSDLPELRLENRIFAGG